MCVLSPERRVRASKFTCCLALLHPRRGEGSLRTKTPDTMRQDCDERACQNAFLYIASWRNDWDKKYFCESGEQAYQRLVESVLQKLQFDPRDRSVGKLGCGAGRMTCGLASRFSSVSALDISLEMQARAKTYLHNFFNTH